MNYRTPAEAPQHAKVIFARGPRGRLLRHAFTVVLVGFTLFGASAPAQPGVVVADDVDSGDDVHTELRVPHHSSAIVSERAAREAAGAYGAFVADRTALTLDRHVPGSPWRPLVLVLPILVLVVLLRRSERAQRLLVDVEGDALLVEELDVRGVQRRLVRFRLSTIEETSIESVSDSDAYELVAKEGAHKRPLYRATDDDCRAAKRVVDQAVARARALRAGKT